MKHGPSLAFRLTVYPLVLLLFVVVSAFVVFFAAGYNFKYKDGKLTTEKTGVIIVATRPGEAVVALDGEVQPKKTPSLPIFNIKIQRVVSGTHRLVVTKDGYESWEGDVVVEPGFVAWRDYLILVPLKRKADPYNFPGSLTDLVVSPDKTKILALSVDRAQGVYSIWQIGLENKTSIKISEKALPASESVDLVSVSGDSSRYMFTKTDQKTKKVSYHVGEAKESGSTYDLGSLFSSQPEGYYFSPYGGSELFFVQRGGLYKINLNNRTESAILTSDVIGVYPVEGHLLLIRKVEDNYGLWSFDNNGETTNIIKSLPAATGYSVSYLKNTKSYLVSDYADRDLMLYSNGVKTPTLEVIARGVSSYVVSPQGSSVAYYSEGKLQVFDISEKKYYQTLMSEGVKTYSWVQDGKNIIYGTDNSVGMINYNGDYNKKLFDTKEAPGIIVSVSGHNLFFSDTREKDKDLYSFSF